MIKHRALSSLYGLVLILTVGLLLTGCGEEETDYDNAKDPETFVTTEMNSRYNRNVIIDRKTMLGKEDYYFDVHFDEEPEIQFDVQTRWVVNAALPTRHYYIKDNYVDKKNVYLCKKYLPGMDGITFSVESSDSQDPDNRLKIYDCVLTLDDNYDISRLAREMGRLNTIEEFTNIISFKVVYRGEYTWMDVSFVDSNDVSYYQDKVDSLLKMVNKPQSTEEETTKTGEIQ